MMLDIKFKSRMEFFRKERDGRKPNTERSVQEEDERFGALARKEPKTITITNADDPSEHFTREITDISYWNSIWVISWKHRED